MVTYDHSVKVNGKWYGAGEVIDTSSASVTAEEKKAVTEPKEEKKRSTNKDGK